jgi:GNAT superfamily N-acetyltransferase
VAATVGVREAGADEAPAVAALHLGTALHAYAHIFPPEAPVPVIDDVVGQWSSWLGRADGAATAFVAERTGEIIGVVLAAPDPARAGAHWGRGIGRRLHDEALSRLTAAGYPEATLWVLERNQRARSWYERLGWVATGARKPVYEPAGIVDVGYRRALP